MNPISTTKTDNSALWESAPLSDWGLILVEGPDSEQFLQNQLTNSVQGLESAKGSQAAHGSAQVRLVGYCSPKGRLLASAWLLLQVNTVGGEEIKRYGLLISRDIAASTAKRLSMYVLRSKLTVKDVSDSWEVEGHLIRDAKTPYLGNPDEISLQLPSITVDGDTFERVISARPKKPDLNTHKQSKNLELWNDLEVLSGIPRIVMATQEQFVPQMINFESVAGIDFKKGCYPGQEIVARSQYRGAIKRRLHLARLLDHDLDTVAYAPGTEVFQSQDPNQPAGMVVLSAKNPFAPSRIDLQIEIKLEALENGDIHLGSIDGPVLKIDSLPYPLIEI